MTKVTVDDGVEISYYLDAFTDPWEGEAETIMMHHGSSENSKFFIPMVPALARRYRVLRFDARGRGESSAPPEGSTLSGAPVDDGITVGERLVKDSINLLDQLGIQKVHLFGVSSGGTVAILFAVSYPERVKSLILCTACIKYPRDRALANCLGEKDVATAIRKWGYDEWRRRRWSGALDAQGAKGERIEQWELSERVKVPGHVMAAYLTWVHEFDLTGVLPKIKVPTLVLSAEKSTVTTLEQQCFLSQQIPNSKHIAFDDIGHGIHVLIPDRVTNAMLDFLRLV